jgi:pilus assembly protein CpaB
MNKRFIGVLMFAFVVATAGGLITYRSLLGRSQPAKAVAPTVKIVLAVKNLEVGSVVKETDVQASDWAGAVPEGATAKVQDVIGRGVLTPIYAKEPVVESRLALRGSGGGLSAMIPHGMRAFTVPVNEVVGVAGFVVPGSHVDLIINGTKPSGDSNLGTLSRTLFQNLEVLSAGQDFRRDPEGKPLPVTVVNVLVTPEQAEVLSLATNQTSIRMILRNPLDHDIAKTPGSALAYLFTNSPKKPLDASDDSDKSARPARTGQPTMAVHIPPPAPPPLKKEAPFNMEIISGTAKTQVKFEKTAVAEGK